MEMTDYLFRTHLHYQIEANSDEGDDKEITLDEIKHIDLHRCHFDDFKKAMLYVRDNYPDYYFSDATLDAIKPAGYRDDTVYDFVVLSDYAKHTAITIGNMALFNELQKIASASELLNVKNADLTTDSDGEPPMDSYLNYNLEPTANVIEELGSCVIGGGTDDTYKLTAVFHDSSRRERPIISVHSYSINTGTYLPNTDIIDISTIYKPNATLMEAFAYMCYEDYRKKRDTQSFDKLLVSGDVDVDKLDDMYSQHYDLRIYDKLYG